MQSDVPGAAYDLRNLAWGVAYMGEERLATQNQVKAYDQIKSAYDNRPNARSTLRSNAIVTEVLFAYIGEDSHFREVIARI